MREREILGGQAAFYGADHPSTSFQPHMLPRRPAAWVQQQEQLVLAHKRSLILIPEEQVIARRAGIARPEAVRILGVPDIPLPSDLLRAFVSSPQNIVIDSANAGAFDLIIVIIIIILYIKTLGYSSIGELGQCEELNQQTGEGNRIK